MQSFECGEESVNQTVKNYDFFGPLISWIIQVVLPSGRTLDVAAPAPT